MKRALAPHANHLHYMMDSELFLSLLDRLYLWIEGARHPLTTFSLVYLDGRHDPDLVWSEIERLLPRVVPGGFHNGKQSILRVGGPGSGVGPHD